MKFLNFVLAILFCFVSICFYACDAAYPKATSGLLYQKIEGKEEYKLIGLGSGGDIDIVVASKYDKMPVTEIADGAFTNRRYIESVIIPNSVINIGDQTFFGCSGLASVILPENISTIGREVFHGCSRLTNVVIPNRVTTIDDYAFYGCTSLTSLSIPNSVTTIGYHAFAGCSGLTRLFISCDVTTIEFGALNNCSGLKEIILPFVGENKVVTDNTHFGHIFGAGFNYYNSSYVPVSLEKVTIFGGAISSRAFMGCSNLTSVILGDDVESIGVYAFSDCSNLTSVIIGENVKTIDAAAFSGCSSLTSIKYCGTKKQWQAIEKDSMWDYGAGKYVVTYNYSE